MLQKRMSVIRRLLSVALFPLILGLLSATACYIAAGPSLGLFLAGVVLVSFIVPPICMAEPKTSNRLLAVGVFVSGIIIIWLIASIRSNTPVAGMTSASDVRSPGWELWRGNGVWSSEWALASVILLSYALALAGLSAGLRLVRCSAIVSAALTVILALAWLTWPIYMSRTWDGESSEAAVDRLIVLHPGMAINAQVYKLGAWTGQ
jgi:hypothetical protein